ncbi:MAG: hypothetical protein HOK72_13685, partial [Flavobacteriales bacterium]|nr:hypothetical protein [Flavobacteriales bacterium]
MNTLPTAYRLSVFYRTISLLFLFLILSIYSMGQIAVLETSPLADLSPCETTSGTIQIDHNTNFGSDPVDVEFNLPNHIVLNAVTAISGGTLNTIVNPGTSSPTVKIDPNFGATSIYIDYEVTASCESFSPTSVSPKQNQIAVYLNSILVEEFACSIYELHSPWLVLDASSVDDCNADLSTAVSRSYTYSNPSSIPFTGKIIFTDQVELPGASDVQFLGPPSVNLSGGGSIVSISTTSTGDLVTITVEVENLPQNGQVIFSDYIELINCESTDVCSERSVEKRTAFHIEFGCLGETPCQSPSGTEGTVVTYPSTNGPELTVTLMNPGYPVCFDEPIRRIFKIENTGTTASQLLFQVRHTSSITSQTAIDMSSVAIFSDAACTVSVAGGLIPNWYPSYIIYPDAFGSDGSMPGMTTWYLCYDEILNCVSTPFTSSDFNTSTNLHMEAPLFKLDHLCYPSEIDYFGNVDYLAHEHPFSGPQNLLTTTTTLIQTDVIPLVRTTEWFDVKSTALLRLGWPGVSTHRYQVAYDPANSEIQIEVDLTPGLGIVNGENDHLGPSTNIRIHSESTITGAPDIYPYEIEYIRNGIPATSGNGDRLVAHFTIPSSFYEPGPANASSIAAGLHWKYNDNYLDFFSDYTVQFNVETFCEFLQAGGKATMEERSFFIANTTPADACNECKIPLGSDSQEINITCPGCVYPGWNLENTSVTRLNIGYTDDDNNNYPDHYVGGLIDPSQEADSNLAHMDHALL